MKKNYFFLFFILIIIHNPLHSQGIGNGECFGFISSAGPKAPCRFVHPGIGIIVLSDTMTFRREKDLHSPQFQFGLGFTFTELGSKSVSDVPLLAPRNDSASVKLTNEYVTLFIDARYIAARDYSGYGFFPYFDFFTGYRYLASHMTTTPYHKLAGYESMTDTYPAKASGLLLGFGVGLHTQVRIRKTNLLFDSELMWDYCPSHGMLAKTSSLQPDPSGIYVDTEHAPNNLMMLKIGLCFNTKLNSYGNSEADYYAEHPPVSAGGSSGGTYHSGGSSGGGGGAHNGVHVNSGGHHGGHAK